MKLISPIVTLFFLMQILACDGDALCKSPQYLELGKRGTVQCHFPDSFFGILWYNTSDYLKNDPLAYVKGQTERGGIGYDSNEYYISSNGSLIINEVSLQDDRDFTVVILDTPIDDYSPNNIHVIVTVRPYQKQPHIQGCNVDEQFCVKIMNDSSELSCSVKDARPAVDLNWYRNNFSRDHLLSSKENVTFENNLYTTIVKTIYTPHMNENVVYVCKSVSAPLLMANEYSVVLIRSLVEEFEETTPTIVYAKHLSSIELPCTEEPSLYLVWKKTGPDNRSRDLISTVSMNNSLYTKFHSYYYHLTNQGSLRIAEIDVQDEGLYTCVFGDGKVKSVKMFNLQVYVMPDPESPMVEGCHGGGYCSLTVPKTGELKCSLMGIRPMVKLRWETVNDNQKSAINFSIVSYKVDAKGFSYDIHLTSQFRIQESFTEWIYIRCIAMNLGNNPFNRPISRRVYLSQLKGPSQEENNAGVNSEEETKNDEKDHTWLGFLAVAFITVVGITVVLIVSAVQERRPHSPPVNREAAPLMDLQNPTEAVQESHPHSLSVNNEAVPLMDSKKPTEEEIRIFKEELKTKYTNTWERVYPLPYDKTISYPINEIFIEGEIEHLEKVVDEELGKFYIWQKLDSHNDFLKQLWQTHIQTVLEGEPGFGKTTLGYQFALDWAKENEQSPLKDVDIYILLRLRYIKDASSIPSAIKKFLLPGNSSLSVSDVQNILYYSSSVVIFLDGYNRFSEKDSQVTFMKDIHTNNICSKCHVIVTTKPFCLPDEHVNNVNRMRLTGFGKESWRKYLRKSVAGVDAVEEKRIMKLLHDNPLLSDLCQVPLFFVLFAHITKNHGKLGGKFSTVTTFFDALIDHFHSKIDSDITVNEHAAISSVCLDGLLKEEKGLIWGKADICNRLGQTLYKEYLRVGLIVEKQFCVHQGRVQHRNNRSVIYETKVRFFHDVFCEWYAAKELAKLLKTADQTECKQYFAKIHPLDHQYVYRFACASDSETASKIIKYIHSMKDGEKFSILCILEQSSDFQNVEEIISNVCSSPVIITNYDNLFLQRSTVQVLQFASAKKLNIVCVWLGRTNSTFDDDKGSLGMSSGIFLPKLATLRQLAVHDPGRQLSKEDVFGFVKYVCLCDSLKDLRFQACLLPFFHREDLDSIKSIIGKKVIDVQWEIPVHERYWYTLDMQSGKWRYMGHPMSEEKYGQVVHSFGLSFRTGHGINDSADDPDEDATSSV